MADPVSIRLIPGPGRGLRFLEWSLLILGLLAPLYLNPDWTWKLALWALVLMILIGEIILAGKRPAISQLTVDINGDIDALTNTGDTLPGRVSSPVWLCDAFCIVPVVLPLSSVSRSISRSLFTPWRCLIIAAANNAPDNYRIMRVWCRLQPWND